MTLYAKIDQRMWPPGLEEVEYLAKQLKQACWDYDVQMERLMFAGLRDFPQFRFVIVKWGRRNDYNDRATRTVVWEGQDMEQCTGMLRMLISVERSEAETQQIARH